MFYDDHGPTEFLRHAIGRHRGRHGWGGRGGGDAVIGRGDGFPAARRLGADDLQLLLLLLLEAQPAHGYELIRVLGERSGGFYAPSPGMVYPALTFLDEIGRVAATPEGNRKLYAITEEGTAFLAANRARADAILDALIRIGSRMEGVRDAFSGVSDVDPDAADVLHRARHALKHALMERRGCPPEEARRVAAILDAATAAILNGGRA